MKKLLVLFLTVVLSFSVIGCSSNEPIQQPSSNESESVTQNVSTSESKGAAARKCEKCKRFLALQNSPYCKDCKCYKKNCSLLSESMSRYCLIHKCQKSGCSLERSSNTNYCVRHQQQS